MGVIATLLPQATRIQRLRVAIRDRHEVIICSDWEALREACDTHAVRLVVIDLYATGEANFERVRELKQGMPRLTIIAYSTITLDRVRDVFDTGRVGVDALVIPDQDDSPRQLLALIERAESRSLGSVVRQSLDEVHPSVRDAVLLAITRAHERLSPEGLAKLLALPRRTVSARLTAAGFPPPRRLLTWGRLVVAAHLLEDQHRTADRVAASLGFPSGSAFRNLCQRYLHATPGDIRQRGGAEYVVRAMLRHARHSPSSTRIVQSASGTPVVTV
jgi:AraC-like DNA-binding protein